MYWKPIIKVQVAPGGENRFRDLQLLLDGSGLEVRRTDLLQQPQNSPGADRGR